MTEERIVASLRALINTGAILGNPDVFTVDSSLEEGLMVECGERRFIIVDPHHHRL